VQFQRVYPSHTVFRDACASADAASNLLHLRPGTELHLLLGTDHWMAVADEIHCGRCNVQLLCLEMEPGSVSVGTEAVKAIASAIRCDCNLKYLTLEMENCFTDEAGVALAKALTVNRSLRKITLSADTNNYESKATFGAHVYGGFSAMLRINTSLVLKLPPFGSLDKMKGSSILMTRCVLNNN
jgi:hypothetical protein